MWSILRNVSESVRSIGKRKRAITTNTTSTSKDSSSNKNNSNDAVVSTPDKKTSSNAPASPTSSIKPRPAIDFMRMSKYQLEQLICEDMSNVDPALVMRLGHMMLESGLGIISTHISAINGSPSGGAIDGPSSPNNTSAASPKKNSRYIFQGAVLMNWASLHGFEMSVPLMRILAYALTETWLSRGLSNEAYCLARAKALYEAVLHDPECAKDCSVWLEYSQTLLYLGDYDIGTKAVSKMVLLFKDDANLMPILLLNATAMNFAAGNFEHAWKFLFRLIQLQEADSSNTNTATYGATATTNATSPTSTSALFSKGELMFMLARIFERCGEGHLDRAREAYYMVYENIQQFDTEFEIPVFEEWILDGALWSLMGDKSVSLGLYALAADLYSQSITRDVEYFDTPKQWFLVAKAHFRCGQVDLAVRALREANARNSTEELFKRAIAEWTRSSSRSHTSGLVYFLSTAPIYNIMSLNRPNKAAITSSVRRGLEPFYYGENARKFPANAPLTTWAEAAEGMIAKAGVTLCLPPKDNANSTSGAATPTSSSASMRKLYLIISSKVHYASQSVRAIKLFDMRSNRNIVVKLKAPFKLPQNLLNSQMGSGFDGIDGGISMFSNSLTAGSTYYNIDSNSNSITDFNSNYNRRAGTSTSSRRGNTNDDNFDDNLGENMGFQTRLGQNSIPLGGALLQQRNSASGNGINNTNGTSSNDFDERSRISASVDVEGDLLQALKVLSEFKLVILCKTIENIESKSTNTSTNTTSTTRSSKIIIALRFVHKFTGRYSMRQLSLSFAPDGTMSVGESKNDTFGTTIATSSTSGNNSIIMANSARLPYNITTATSSEASVFSNSLINDPNTTNTTNTNAGIRNGSKSGSLTQIPIYSNSNSIAYNNSSSGYVAANNSSTNGSVLSPVREDMYINNNTSNSNSKITTTNGRSSSNKPTSNSSNVVVPVARSRNASYNSTDGGFDDNNSTSNSNYNTYNDATSNNSGRGGSFEETSQSGIYSKLTSLASSYFNSGYDSPVRGSMRYSGTIYLYRFYAPEDDPLVDENHPHKSDAMSVHILNTTTDEVLVFSFPPESVDSIVLVRQIVYFLLSTANAIGSDLVSNYMKSTTTTAAATTGTTIDATSAAISTTSPKRRHRKGVYVCDRYILTSISGIKPGYVRIYLTDPLMRPIISIDMAHFARLKFGDAVEESSSFISDSLVDSLSLTNDNEGNYNDNDNEDGDDDNASYQLNTGGRSLSRSVSNASGGGAINSTSSRRRSEDKRRINTTNANDTNTNGTSGVADDDISVLSSESSSINPERHPNSYGNSSSSKHRRLFAPWSQQQQHIHVQYHHPTSSSSSADGSPVKGNGTTATSTSRRMRAESDDASAVRSIISNGSSSVVSKSIVELGGSYEGADIHAIRAARESRASLDIGRLLISSSTPPIYAPNDSKGDRKTSIASVWSTRIDSTESSAVLAAESSHITPHPGDELFYNAGIDALRKASIRPVISVLPAMEVYDLPPSYENGYLLIDWRMYASDINTWGGAAAIAVLEPRWLEVGGGDNLSYASSLTILRRGAGPDLYIHIPTTQRTQVAFRTRADSNASIESSASLLNFLSPGVDLTTTTTSGGIVDNGIVYNVEDPDSISLHSESHPAFTDDNGLTDDESTVMTGVVSILPEDEFIHGISWNDSHLAGSLVDDAIQCALLKCDAISRASQRVHRLSNRRMSAAVQYALSNSLTTNASARRASAMRRQSMYRASNINAGTSNSTSMDIGSISNSRERAMSEDRRTIDFSSLNGNDKLGITIPTQPSADAVELAATTTINDVESNAKPPAFYVEEEEQFLSKEVENSVMSFMLWQNRLADATEYLFCKGTQALSVENKKEAFDYLLQRVQQAQEIVAAQNSKKIIRMSKLKSKAMSFIITKRRPSMTKTGEKAADGTSTNHSDVVPQAPSYILHNRAANKKHKALRRASAAITVGKKIEDITSMINLREIQQRILKAELQRQEEEALAKKRQEDEERAAFLRIKPTDPLKDPALLVEVLSRTLHAMPLSYTAQLGNTRRGNSTSNNNSSNGNGTTGITWEDGLEDGQLGGGPAKERPVKSAKTNKSVGRHRNPVHFLDDPSLDSFDAFNKSIGEYRSCGYPSGSREYFEVWSQKIKTSLDRFTTVGQLSRSMEMLRKSVERETGYDMSRAEALCALAEAKGSTSEALGVLKDSSFLEEATSVSRSVPTDDIASILEKACKLGMAAFSTSGNKGEKRRDGKRQGLTQAEAIESKNMNRKEKDAAVFDLFKELVYKILDSQLSPDTIVQIAKVQGESDLSAASVFMPQVIAARAASAEDTRVFGGSGSVVMSGSMHPTTYSTGNNQSRASGFLPAISNSNSSTNGHSSSHYRGALGNDLNSPSVDSHVSFGLGSPLQQRSPNPRALRNTNGTSGIVTSSSLTDLDVPRSQLSPLRNLASSSVSNLSVRSNGGGIGIGIGGGINDDARSIAMSEWGSSVGAFGSVAMHSEAMGNNNSTTSTGPLGAHNSMSQHSNQKAVSDALRIERTIRRIMRSSLDDRTQLEETVYAEKDLYASKTRRGAVHGAETMHT